MIYEKKKILITRLVWLTVLLISIILYIIPASIPKIIDENVYAEYDSYYNKTAINITLYFDSAVNDCSTTISFYDSNELLLETKTIDLSCYGTTAETIFSFSVQGNVDSYEIISYQIYGYKDDTLATILLFIGLIGLLFSFSRSYKIYTYENNNIIVYSGLSHHYIKLNGTIVDELNCFISYHFIFLSCTLDNGDLVEATIPLSKDIKLKINNYLQKPLKTNIFKKDKILSDKMTDENFCKYNNTTNTQTKDD